MTSSLYRLKTPAANLQFPGRPYWSSASRRFGWSPSVLSAGSSHLRVG